MRWQLQLQAHVGAVWDICLSPLGDMLASIGADGYLRLWYLPDGWPVGILEVSVPGAACFSGCGNFVIYTGVGTTHVRAVGGGEAFALHGCHGSVRVASCEDRVGGLVGIAGIDGHVSVWAASGDSGQLALLRWFDVAGIVRHLTVSEAGLAGCVVEGRVEAWDVVSGERILSVQPGPGWVYEQLVVEPRGAWVRAVDNTGVVRQWATRGADRSVGWDAPLECASLIEAGDAVVALSPSGQYAAAAGGEGRVAVWPVGSGAHVMFDGGSGCKCQSLALGLSVVAAGYADGTLVAAGLG